MICIGIDSETLEGKPMTLQYFSDDIPRNIVEDVTDKTAFPALIRFINDLPQNDSTYILWGHNLSFDLVSFFYSKKELFVTDRFEFDHGPWKISGLYSNGLCYVFMTHKNKHKTVYILDTFRFFPGSLEKLAAIFCPDLPKLKAPDGLGSKKLTSKNKPFRAYAIRDAEIAFTIGKKIISLWQDYDIRPCVSQAQMAARIFRHKYVTETIPLQDKRIIYASLHSYHGGKNNLTVPRGYYKGVHSIDIVSAYPYAMSLFPSFTRPDLYKGLKGRNITTRVPEFGIYKISGIVKSCKWPVVFDHAFKAVQGPFRDIWITGFEINEAIRAREIEITELYGYYYDALQDRHPSAFKHYIKNFFKLKNEASDPITRQFAKIMLNALYGKFIQKDKSSIEINYTYDLDTGTLDDTSQSFTAGGLFNPFIASLITGHTRAYIHKLEHKYKAIHTATDGIITTIKPKKAELSDDLGGIKLEYSGDVYIFRNKCYIFYNNKKTEKPSIVYKNKFIQKYAHHGFHGNITILEQMLKNGIFEYEYTKVNKLKESLRRGIQVNKFEKRSAVLNLDK